MVSTPVQNFSNFLKNRPPLVIFLLCLVVLAVSTFYFAFEVEKDDRIIDSDKKHDWIKMVKYFNGINTCLSMSKWKDEIDQKKNEIKPDEQIVYSSVKVEDIDYLKSFSEVHGFLTLEDWLPVSCHDNKSLPKNMRIFFIMPPAEEIGSSQNICVTIKGPARYLPYFKNPPCVPAEHTKGLKSNIGLLSSKLPKNSSETFCDNGKIVKMIFDLQEMEIANYLSDDIRTQIYMHLMWCSYFLVFVIFVFLIYAIVRKSEYLEKKEHNVRLL